MIMAAATIGVLVVDDDPLTRQAVITILGGDPLITVTGQAADGAEAWRLASDLGPDVVLMDIRMPRMDGLDALRRIRRDRPQLPVVMLTTFSDHDLVEQALTEGAAGFLLKTSAPEELSRAVRSAHHGGLFMSPTVSRWVVDSWVAGRSPQIADRSRVNALSPRQHDVLQALADGDSNADIGRRLHLSEGTVKGYVSEIIAALGVRNRVEAAVVAHRAR